MKLNRIAVTLATALCLQAPASNAEHRQLGPHEHGHGSLNIALEGRTLTMELEAPGDDIVGFEHEPSTPEEKATLEHAQKLLHDGLKLFSLPAEARCAEKSAEVKIEPEEEEGEEAGKTHGKAEEHHHNAFHVTYTFDCAAPAGLRAIGFKYFETFTRAQALTVAIITPKGQSAFEVTRSKPELDLSSLL